MKTVFNSPVDSVLTSHSDVYQNLYDTYKDFENMIENDSASFIKNEEVMALAILAMGKTIQIRNILTNIDKTLIDNMPQEQDVVAQQLNSYKAKPEREYIVNSSENVKQILMVLSELQRSVKANSNNQALLESIEEKIVEYVKQL